MKLSKTGAAFLLLFYFLLLAGCSKQAPEHTIVQATGDVVKIPIEEVNDGSVHFYTYKLDGKNINFLVRTDGKGKLHTHFDACYSCYQYKKGYRVKEPYIVCIACTLKYHLDEELWDFIGPCAPITLKSSIEGDHLVIERERLERGKKLF